jgi:hypothetical protein
MMPKPFIYRVSLVQGADGDQWLKASARLRKWAILGNDAAANCSFRAIRDGTPEAVGLLVAGVPEPSPTFSFEPGDECEIQVAIWLPATNTVHMSRELDFRLDGHDPRFLSLSRCYGRVDRTPTIPDGVNTVRLQIMRQGKCLAELRFNVTVNRHVGFSDVSILPH